MAAAVRVTEPRLVPIDEFGIAVTRRLLVIGRVGQIDQGDLGTLIARSRPGLPVVIGASWRNELTKINDLAAIENVPWFPVVLRRTRIDIGPEIGPDTGVCYRCMQVRERQHDPHRRTTEIVETSTARRAAFLPAQVWQTAGIINRHITTRARTPHTVSTISLGLYGTTPIAAHPVIGVHGCSGCALRTSVVSEQERA